MKTITIKQPWASLIVDGVKDIENRSWKLPEKYKGERVLIHASKKTDHIRKESQLAYLLVNELLSKVTYSPVGAIIGSVVLVDCVRNHESIWAEKDSWNWVLANPVKFDEPIVNVNGKLSFWEYAY